MWWDTSMPVIVIIYWSYAVPLFPQYAVEIFQTLDENLFIFIALYRELEGITSNKMQRRVEPPYLRPTEWGHGSLRFFYIPTPNMITPKNIVALSAL